MDLNNLVPDKDHSWSVNGNYLMYKKLEKIPMCYQEDNTVYIFLDARLNKQVLKLTEHLIKLDINFFFTSPEASNPSGILDFHKNIIRHYLTCYSTKIFFFGFKKINFDLIDNMVKWTDKEDCFYLVKSIYQETLEKVQKQTMDYYRNVKVYNYCQEIREEFQSLYRDILISRII